MKHCKRIFTLILSLALVLALSMAVSATEVLAEQAPDDPRPQEAYILVTGPEDFTRYMLWEYDYVSSVYLEAFEAEYDAQLYVRYPDGREEQFPVTYDEKGEYTKIITSTSVDGTVSRNYRVDVCVEQPRTVPTDLFMNIYVGEDAVDYKILELEEGSTTLNVDVTSNFGIPERYSFEYYDVDETYVLQEIIPDAQGNAVHQFRSANGKTYTLNIHVLAPSSEVSFSLDVLMEDEEYTWWSEYYNSADERLADGTLTITVPYGAITDHNHSKNDLTLFIYPGVGTVKDIPLNEDYNCAIKLLPATSQTIVKSFTIIAPDGVTEHHYTVTVVEGSAADTSVSYIETWSNEGNGFSYMLDPEAAGKPAGVTVLMPYGTIPREAYLYPEISHLGQITGIQEDHQIQLEADGNTTVTFQVVSADGSKTQTYTIHYVADTAGDVINAQYTLFWHYFPGGGGIMNVGELDVDMAAAATKEGAVVYLDRALHTDDNCYTMGTAKSPNFGTVTVQFEDMAGNLVEDSGVGDYMIYPEFDGKDSDTIYFTVSSPDGTKSQDYKITFILCDDHIYENGSCTKCGAEGQQEEETTKFDIAYANMTLGNSLAMNFAFEQGHRDDWSGCYVRIIKEFADGRPARDVTVPFEEWGAANIGGVPHYTAKFPGVAAKEMSDNVIVYVCNAQGEELSNVWVDSVRGYAMRTLNNPNTSRNSAIMVVDLLNYGAAAQEYFGYNVGDLANSQLSAEQKALATKTAPAADGRVMGDNYRGTNLGLESQILMRMAFAQAPADAYATIEFTNHSGNKVKVDVKSSEILADKGSSIVVIDEIVVADGRKPVTVTVYNADGTIFASATDSMEGYIARMRKDKYDPLFEAILKFSDSAYNFFHN